MRIPVARTCLFVVLACGVLAGLSWGDTSTTTWIQLHFHGHLTTRGSCTQVSESVLQCEVAAGVQGQIALDATVSPSDYIVVIGAVSLPVWASFETASGYGAASTVCAFTAPQSTVGTTRDLVFQASVPGTQAVVTLTVQLTVQPQEVPRTYSGVTDTIGGFRISIPDFGGTIVGTLTECTKRTLTGTQFTLTLAPVLPSGELTGMGSIGSISISAAGYRTAVITDFTRYGTEIVVGEISLFPISGSACGAPCDGSSTTADDGTFTISLPLSGASVSGTLTVCTAAPLANQDFCIRMVPREMSISSAADVAGFTFAADGYTPTTVTQFGKFTLFGMTSFSVGTVSLLPLLPGGEALMIGDVVHGVFKSGMIAPDGVIGPEWDGVPGTEIVIPGSDTPAVLKVAYDDANVYVSLNSPLPTGFGSASGIEFTIDGGDGFEQPSTDTESFSIETSQPVAAIPTSGVPLTAAGPMPLTLTLDGTSPTCRKPVDVDFTGVIVFDPAPMVVDLPGAQPTTASIPPRNPVIAESPCPTCAQNTLLSFDNDGIEQASGDPVALHSGELYLHEVDLTIPGRGIDWTFERTYASGSNYEGVLGYGWSLNYDQRLAVTTSGNLATVRRLFPSAQKGDVVRVDATGLLSLYSRNPDGTYATPKGDDRAISQTLAGSFRERNASGTVIEYVAPDTGGNARMARMADRDGNTMEFERDAAGRLTAVVDTLGRRITYSYDGDHLTSVCDFAGRSVTYAYDEHGDLVAVTGPVVTGTPTGNDFPNGTTTRYAYSSGYAQEWLNHDVVSITSPNEVASGGPPQVQYEYDTNPASPHADRVVRQILGGVNDSGVPAGGTITYQYQTLAEAARDTAIPAAERSTLLTTASAEWARLDASGPAVADASQPGVYRAVVTDRSGNIKEYRFDARGHAILMRTLTNRDVSPSDPSYFETRLAYDDAGNLTQGTRGGGSQTVFEYFSADGSACCGNDLRSTTVYPDSRGGDQESIVTSHLVEPVYHQRSLGVDECGQITIYTYDYQEGTDYARLAAVLGVTEFELTRRLADAGVPMGLGDVNGDGRTDQIAGNLIRVESPSVVLSNDSPLSAVEPDLVQEIVENYAYDDAGRLVREVDPEGNVTLYEYYADDASRGAGLLRSVAQDAERAAGRDSGTDPTPAAIRTLYEYDVFGNVTRITDGRGIVTEYIHDALGRVVEIVRAAAHTTPADSAAEPLALTDFRYLERTFYDANGNVVRHQVEDRGDTSGVGADNAGTGTAFVDTTYTYDILNQRVSMSQEVSDALDLVTLYRYDPNGNLVLTVYPEGNATASVFDERDLVSETTAGALTPPAAALLAPNDPRSYNVRGGTPSTTTYHYDLDRNLIEVVDAEDTDGSDADNSALGGAGDRTRMIYDGFGRRTSVIDSVGNQTVWQYDAAGNVVRELRFGPSSGSSPTSDGPAVLRFPVSSLGVIQATNLVSANLLEATEYVYDEMGRLARTDRVLFVNAPTVRPPDVQDGATDIGKGDLTPGDDYPIPGVSGVQILGRVSSETVYDRASRPVFGIEDDLDTVQYIYDGAGRVTRSIDPEGNSVETAYDANDNVIETRETDVAQTAGVVAEIFLTTYFYDSLNRLVRVVDNLGGTSEYRYDSRGNLVAKSDALGPLDGELVARRAFAPGALTQNETNAFGNVVLYAYDGLGRQLSEDTVLTADGEGTGQLGVTLEGVRVDQRGDRSVPAALAPDPTQSTDGVITVRYAWDRNSLLQNLTDDNGNQTQYAYDNLNRRVTETKGICVEPHFADRCDTPTTITSVYDADGNLARLVDENGSVTDFCYDAIGRRISLTIARAAGVVGTTEQTFEYDGRSRLTRATDNNEPADASDDSLITYAYDSLSRVIEETQRTGALPAAVVSSAWRADGLSIGLTYPNGRVVDSTYDALDRLDTIGDAGASLPIADYNYIGTGRVLTRAYPQNGTEMTYLTDAGDASSYDGLGRPTELRHVRADGTLVVGFTYTYDRVGNKLSEGKLHDPANDEVYGYDSAYRLIRFDRPNEGAIAPLQSRWTLDGVGNWLQVDDEVREYSSLNELISRDGTTLDYDANGNELTDGTFLFAWDALNRLRSATRLSDGAVVGVYSYDAAGRRTQKVVTNSGDLDGTTHFYLDGWQEIEERDAANALVQQYVYGVYIDEPLVLDRYDDGDGIGTGLDETRLFYHQDAHHSVCSLTDVEAHVFWEGQYEGYGRPTSADIAGNPYLFTGRRLDLEIDLYDFRTRYAAAELGRFLSRDPIGDYAGGLGPYEFTHGNPITALDPTGLLTEAQCRAAAADAETAYGDELAAIKQMGCHVPLVQCTCCGTAAENAGYYDWSTKDITICYDKWTNSTQYTVQLAVQHELVHAYDHCMGMNQADCLHRACREIRAYSKSGQCDTTHAWRAQGETRQECVRKYSILSTEADPTCRPAWKYVQAAFDRCYIEYTLKDLPAPPHLSALGVTAAGEIITHE